MKKAMVTVFVVGCLLLLSCGDNMKAYQVVQQEHPNSKIVEVPDIKYTFLVIKENGNIRLVRTYIKSNKITRDILIHNKQSENES